MISNQISAITRSQVLPLEESLLSAGFHPRVQHLSLTLLMYMVRAQEVTYTVKNQSHSTRESLTVLITVVTQKLISLTLSSHSQVPCTRDPVKTDQLNYYSNLIRKYVSPIDHMYLWC